MICNTCGRSIANEEANFCEYCGFSFRESTQPVVSAMEHREINLSTTHSEKSITFLNWLMMYGLLLIPFIGWLLFLVILFYWSFGNSTSSTKKNWARATLVFAAVYIFMMIAVLMNMIGSPMFQELLSGNY